MNTKRSLLVRPHHKLALVGVLVTIAAVACSNVVELGSNSGTTSGTAGGAGTTSASTTSGFGGGAIAGTSASSSSGFGGGVMLTTSAGSGGAGGAGTGSTTSSSSSSGDPTVSVSPASSFEYDTHLAVASNGDVFVTWIGVPSSGTPFVGYAVSSDGAMTFPVQGTVPTPGGRSADHPTLATDGQGNVYLAWLGFVEGASGTPADTHVYVAMSPAGSTTFGAAVEASEPMGFTYANPWITVTPMGNPMVTFQRSGTVDLGVVAARSADMGMTWTTSVVATDTHLLNDRDLPDPCGSATTGRIFVTYFFDDPAIGVGIGIGWSDDDGVTWIDPEQTPEVDQFNPSDPSPRVYSPPRCVAVETTVRVIYGTINAIEGNPPSTDGSFWQLFDTINYAESVNGGATFGLEGSMHAPSCQACNGSSFLNPQLISDPPGGYDLVYYTELNVDASNGSYAWGRSPQPMPLDFNPPTTIDDITFDKYRTTPTRLGDYTGLAATATTLYTSYVDNSSGASHVRVHAAPLQ